jgi:hypothetical protein
MLRFFACAAALVACCATVRASEPPHSAELDDMIVRQAKRHGVPEKLVRRIVMRESKYNPRARNHSYWGLMQISYPTARSMGFKGSPTDLLDPLVNLTYAVPYLANAFIIAGKQEDAAVRLYASGYYTTAKSRNLLDHLRTAESIPVAPDNGFLAATARPVSNLITAVVGGTPPAQQIAAAAPPPAAGQVGGGPDNAPEVMMTSGKKGYQPPKKWTKDGGVTLIVRGEQPIERVAAYVPPDGAEAKKAAHHGKTKKITEFASLDAPPASAQAYAAPRDQAIQQSASQAAIAQATAGPAAPVSSAQAAAPAEDPAAAVKPAKRAHVKAHSHKALATKPDSAAPAAKASSDAAAVPADDKADKKPVAQKLAAKEKPAKAAAAKAKAPAVAVAAQAKEPTASPSTDWHAFGAR